MLPSDPRSIANYYEAKERVKLLSHIKLEKFKPTKEYNKRSTLVKVLCKQHGISTTRLRNVRETTGGCRTCEIEYASQQTIKGKLRKSRRSLEALLSADYPHIEIKGKFKGLKEPWHLYCSKHDQHFHKRGGFMRRMHGCEVCCSEHRKQNSVKKYTTTSYRAAVSKRTDKITVVGEYVNYSVRNNKAALIEHTCAEHGTFFASPSSVLSKRTKSFGCVECSKALRILNNRRRITEPEFKELLNGRDIEITTPYVDKTSRMDFRCLKDGFEWTTTADSILAGHGCQACAVHAHSFRFGAVNKNYLLGDDLVRVQGYEPQALDLLQKRFEASQLVVGSEVPAIPYTMDGVARTYFPDIFIPSEKRIVEVKSKYTFGFASPSLFKQIKRKREGVLEAGYKFNVMVMTKDGERVRLPSDWHTLGYRALQRL